jgi:nitric-oxide synthase
VNHDYGGVGRQHPSGRANSADTLNQAREFLRLVASEVGLGQAFEQRFAEVTDDIARTGTYTHTAVELAHGARVAWRNSGRCIGRLHWEGLQVCDGRHLQTAQDVFEALVEHVRLSTNSGKIKPLITVFAPREPGQPGLRIWNPQLIRYAGYRQLDGSLVGDPLNADLTEAIVALGWKGGRRTPFDVLPLVIQLPGQRPELFEMPRGAVLEVPIRHPQFAWFADLGLRWHALPAIADMRLEIGGVSYTAAPFSGWYMVTEIGARDFGDVSRYNLLPRVASYMGLDTSTDRSLWRDRALIEMNAAVLHSFATDGVSMVDHHTASRQFLSHEGREHAAGRLVPARWSWIVPPISGSATVVWPRTYQDVRQTPNYFYQRAPWRSLQDEHQAGPAERLS